jgi:hypothetical protein
MDNFIKNFRQNSTYLDLVEYRNYFLLYWKDCLLAFRLTIYTERNKVISILKNL